jgi:hypothetical protein
MERPGTLTRLSALLQIVLAVALIGFSTFELFSGNLSAAMSTFPLLLLLYLFVVAGQKRKR